MAISVTVIGAVDKVLDELLRPVAAPVSHLSEAQFDAAASKGSLPGEVVLLDLRMSNRLPEGLAHVKRHQPDVGIVLVAARLDPTLMLEAMRSGVNEFLAEPLTQADLEAALSRLSAHRQGTTPGLVLAFLGAKGGVGTTTTAVNVAAAAAQDRKSVLFVDLHLSHGDAAVFLGAEPRFSVVDALENVHRLDPSFFKGLVTRTKAGFDLLASSDRPFVPNSATQHVRQLVEFASRAYACTVLDVPRSDAAALDALDAATRIVLVANQELATVRNAARIAEAMRQRYGKERVGVVVSRYDSASEIGQEDIERVTSLRLHGIIPSDYRLALQALNAGRPLMLENHTRLAASYRDLARRLVGEPRQPEVEQASSGIFGRLLGRRS